MFPIVEEAFVQQGFYLEFDQRFKLGHHKPIAPCPDRLMRPTAVILHNNKPEKKPKIAMIGGDEHRKNWIYQTASD